MNEGALNAAMDAAMKRTNSGKAQITQEEADSFKKAFAKPEFRDMFNDYLKEVRMILWHALFLVTLGFQINMEI